MGQRGFSLVEIMVVVGIIGAIAVMSAGSFTDWIATSNYKTQKTTVFEALTRARNMANSRDECARVSIDGQLIHIVGYSAVNGGCDPLGPQSIALPDLKIENGYKLGEFTAKDGSKSNTLLFTPLGGVQGATNYIEIYLADLKGNQQGFRIYPALGQIRTLQAGAATPTPSP